MGIIAFFQVLAAATSSTLLFLLLHTKALRIRSELEQIHRPRGRRGYEHRQVHRYARERRKRESTEHRQKVLNGLPLVRYIPAPGSTAAKEVVGGPHGDKPWERNWVKSDLPYLPLEDHRAGCPICMLDFEEPRRCEDEWEVWKDASELGCNEKEPEPIRLLPCGHVYHTSCIEQWVIHESAVCPYCRKTVVTVLGAPNCIS